MTNSVYTNPVIIDDFSSGADITVTTAGTRIIAAKLVSGTADEKAIFINNAGDQVLHLTSHTYSDVDWFIPSEPFPVDGLYFDHSASTSGSQTIYIWMA